MKQAAILAHATQMQFSRGRFLAFAGEQERFQPAPIPAILEPTHPLSARIDGDRLRVAIDPQRWGKPLRDEVLLVALHGDFSWRSAIDPSAGQAAARAASAKAQQLDVDVALPPGLRACAGFVKLARREPGWRVFDRFGWQAVAI
jgi:hypothetical protein